MCFGKLLIFQSYPNNIKKQCFCALLRGRIAIFPYSVRIILLLIQENTAADARNNDVFQYFYVRNINAVFA